MQSLNVTGGFLRSRKVLFKSSENLRPTLSKTREAIFNVLAGYVDFEHAFFLDMFAGSGIMSFEAVSRGFGEVYAIEANEKTCQNIRKNMDILSVNFTLIKGTVPNILNISEFADKSFSVIFADPPYKSNLYNKIIEEMLRKNLLQKGGILVLESLQNEEISPKGLSLLKSKIYSDKLVTFLSNM